MPYQHLNLPLRPNWEVGAVSDGVFTVVTIKGERYMGLGVAKKHPDDRPNSQIGVDVAISRALEDLASQTREGVARQQK